MRAVVPKAYSIIIVCCCVFFVQSSEAGEEADWKKMNSDAISAMRTEKFEEAEKLFQEALSKCKLQEDRRTVACNLTLMLRKLGRIDEARKIEQEYSPTSCKEPAEPSSNGGRSETSSEDASGTSPRMPQNNSQASADAHIKTLKGSVQSAEMNALIKSLDEQIKTADSTGQLESLQALFQKKADAIQARDHCQSIEYAYTIHYRAQVLAQLKRDVEATALENQARVIRDAVRSMQSGSGLGARAPEIRPSSLGHMNFGFEYTNPYAEQRREMEAQQVHERERNELRSLYSRQQQNSGNGYMNRYNNKFGK